MPNRKSLPWADTKMIGFRTDKAYPWNGTQYRDAVNLLFAEMYNKLSDKNKERIFDQFEAELNIIQYANPDPEVVKQLPPLEDENVQTA